MSIAQITLNLEELARYISEKQNLSSEFKGVNYGHAISILNNIVHFQDPESLFTRMRTFSHTLIPSLIKNKHIVQAPFKSGKLTYVGRDNLELLYYSNLSDEIDYKKPQTRSVLEHIKEHGTSTRQKLIEQFKLPKEEVMEILSELRNNFQVFMFYDGTRWTIYSSEMLLKEESMSQSSAIKDLIYTIIRSYGPITVPQIMSILELSGSRVSTSIIELYESKKIIRGPFIENSSYEGFLAAEELDFIKDFTKREKKQESSQIEILPATDPYAVYWSSADFDVLRDIQKEVVFVSGKPVCTFDYKVIGDKLHVINLIKTAEFILLEEQIQNKIQEFTENKGKILVFPKMQSELLENQSRSFVETLKQRGYVLRSSGFSYHRLKLTKSDGSQVLISIQDVFPLLIDNQFLTKHKQISTKPDLLRSLSFIGIPLSYESLLIRIINGKEHILNELQIDRKIVRGKYSSFPRGVINSEDFSYYAKLRPTRSVGVLEERALNTINQKEKVNFKQLKSLLNLSDRVLLSTLQRLEVACEIIQTKNISNQIIWLSLSKFLSSIKTKTVNSQREAWLEIIFRILSSNLPLSIRQLANLTGLSNTQLEVYLKELIASRNVRTGRFLEEESDVQFTTKVIEESITAYIYQKGEDDPDSQEANFIYLPRADPLILLYKEYLLKRFKLRSFFLRSLPTDFAELILKNGEPVAALHFKKQEKIDYINNIEILPEFSDDHNLMFILSTVQDYFSRTREKGKSEIRIRQINGVPLNSESGEKIVSLMTNMQLDFHIIP
ncbi:MAG: hypothetical protein KGD64_02435 [Candidatus Heimdallarchaeota archaeon]|nr:hypothetical protein [Candidatus Heimdallarchaeota archaeon]